MERKPEQQKERIEKIQAMEMKSCLEKQIYVEGNKIKNIQGNHTPDDICTRNKGRT